MNSLKSGLVCALITTVLALGGCELAAGCDEARWTTTKGAVTPYALDGTSTELDCPKELDTDALMTARDSGEESSAADYPPGQWVRTKLYVIGTQELRDEGDSESCVYTTFEVVNCGLIRAVAGDPPPTFLSVSPPTSEGCVPRRRSVLGPVGPIQT